MHLISVTNCKLHGSYSCRDIEFNNGKNISVGSLYSMKQREVTASYNEVPLELKKLTRGKSVCDQMTIVQEVVGKKNIPYMVLNGPQAGIIVTVEPAMVAYSRVGSVSVLFLDFADSRLLPQKLGITSMEETTFKALFIGVRNGKFTVPLFIALVDKMTTVMTGAVLDHIHQHMVTLKYGLPSPPVVVIDGALTLLQSIVDAYTPYKDTRRYMVDTMKSLFDEFRCGIVTNLMGMPPTPIILRCYFHFKHQILRHFRTKAFKCSPEIRNTYKLLAELIFDSFYCGRNIEEMIGTMVSVYSLLQCKTIRVNRKAGTSEVDWDVDLACLSHICWEDDDLKGYMEKKIIRGRSVTDLTAIFAVCIEKGDDDKHSLVFDATNAKEENIRLQQKYNRTATQTEIERIHRRRKVKVDAVVSPDSGSDVIVELIPNGFFNEAIATYFLDHVFKWWLLICESAKTARYPSYK